LPSTSAEAAAELAVHADVDVGVHQLAHLGQVDPSGMTMLTSAPMPSTRRRISCQVGGHVEHAVHRAEDVDARLRALLGLLLLRHAALGHAELGEEPGHRAVGAFPLVLVDGARQEALDVGALRRHAAADHLGDGARDDDRRQRRVEHVPGALHRALGALAAQLVFGQAGDDDGQLMRAAARRCSAARW
jgi:hypothetical protein